LAELYSFTGDWFRGNVPQIECTVLWVLISSDWGKSLRLPHICFIWIWW
jgi:hypothetical protein